MNTRTDIPRIIGTAEENKGAKNREAPAGPIPDEPMKDARGMKTDGGTTDCPLFFLYLGCRLQRTEEEEGCPWQWHGSGCYDIELYGKKYIRLDVFAHSEKEAERLFSEWQDNRMKNKRGEDGRGILGRNSDEEHDFLHADILGTRMAGRRDMCFDDEPGFGDWESVDSYDNSGLCGLGWSRREDEDLTLGEALGFLGRPASETA